MILTRLRLDPRSAYARRDLADPYEMHRTLERAFAQGEGLRVERILWRVEPAAAWSDPVVLVQAAAPGDWSALRGISGYLKGEVESREVQPANWLKMGARFRFRLVANPTVTRNGKRLGLPSEDSQLEWLQRQGERYGFAVEAALVSGSDMIRARKGEARISLQRACFEGRLQVRDQAAMVNALCFGIGPGKAFGCGLLSLGKESGSQQ